MEVSKGSTSVPTDLFQTDYTYLQSYPQGWVCPKCGRVYNPLMMMCTYCVPQVTVITNTHAYR